MDDHEYVEELSGKENKWGHGRPLRQWPPFLPHSFHFYVSGTSRVEICKRLEEHFIEDTIDVEYFDRSATYHRYTGLLYAKMSILLYCGDNENQIVVELVKHIGDQNLFHDECEIIFNTVKYGKSWKGQNKRNCRPLSVKKRSVNLRKRSSEEKYANFDHIVDLIFDERIESKFVGWKSLCNLTNHKSSFDAVFASQAVLGVGELDRAITDYIIMIVANESRGESEDPDDVSFVTDDLPKRIQILARLVIENSLRTLKEHNFLHLVFKSDVSNLDITNLFNLFINGSDITALA